MFKPVYTLTSVLLNNITSIERLYGQLEVMRLPSILQLNLERDNLFKSSYISNSIEGNPLSLPEVTNLLLGDRVPANRNEKEIRNYFDCLKSLNQYSGLEVNIERILSIHKQLMQGTDDHLAGVIRNTSVVVGGYVIEDGKSKLKIKHEPPFHDSQKITEVLQDVLTWLSKDLTTPPILKSGIFHHQYVYIHPFEDGNGRTCRLLTALVLLKNNYQINKYFVLDDYYDIDRIQYSDKLSTADRGDLTAWLEYFTDGVKYSLESALSRIKNTVSLTQIENMPSDRQQEVINFFKQHKQATSLTIAKQFNVSRQQAHKLLAILVKKGFLKKIGTTKGSYYEIR